MNGIQKALLAVVLIEMVFPLDVYLDYQEAEASYGAIGGWNVSVGLLCLTLLCAGWLPDLASRNTDWSPSRTSAALPGLFYFGAVLLSVAFAERPQLALFEVFSLLPMLLLYLYLAYWVRTRDDVHFVVAILIFGLGLQAAVMLGLRALGHDVQIGPLTGRIDGGTRVGGTIGSPNEAASYLTLGLSLALGVSLTRWPLTTRFAAAGAFALGSAAMIATLSRGGWIAGAVAVTLIGALALVRGRLSLWAPVVVGATALVIFSAFSETISERFSRDDKGAAYSRIPLMMIAGEVIEDRPVFGVGANNMTVAMRPYALSGRFRGGFIYVVHNRYLLAWAETGVIGVAAFLTFLGAALLRGWRCWRRDDLILAPIALGIFAGLAGEMLHMTVDVCRGRPLNQLIWTLAGLVAAMALMEEEQPC